MPNKLTTSEFINRSKEIHKNKYNYSLTHYSTIFKKLKIICPIHGEFIQRANDHLSGYGCPKCGFEKVAKLNRNSINNFIKNARQIHGDKYDYSSSKYKNKETKITIMCPFHGEFKQRPGHHIHMKAGCPSCNSSKAEIQIEKCLNSHKIKFFKQKTFENCRNPKTNRKLRFDFYIPSKNLIIEYDGKQHFISDGIVGIGKYKISSQDVSDTKYRDYIKNHYCKTNKIDILRIPYWKTSRIDIIIERKLCEC